VYHKTTDLDRLDRAALTDQQIVSVFRAYEGLRRRWPGRHLARILRVMLDTTLAAYKGQPGAPVVVQQMSREQQARRLRGIGIMVKLAQAEQNRQTPTSGSDEA
jgi:hypothetical protein